MENHKMLSIKPLRQFYAFSRELSGLLKASPGSKIATLASQIGIQRVRVHHILKGTDQPPGPDVVNRIADLLAVDAEKRAWLQWLALRERADPQVMVLLKVYEDALLKAWGTQDPAEIPRKLETQMRAVKFVLANRPIYIQGFEEPVEVLLHDEHGRMRRSLVKDWIVPVNPAGMYGGEFTEKALDHVVLVNVGKQCRIGWLRRNKSGRKTRDARQTADDFILMGDDDQPLTEVRAVKVHQQDESPAQRDPKGGKPSEATKARPKIPRWDVKDIQALIPDETLMAITAKRKELEEFTLEQLREQVHEKIRRGPLAPVQPKDSGPRPAGPKSAKHRE
jgi:hypothetical protein